MIKSQSSLCTMDMEVGIAPRSRLIAGERVAKYTGTKLHDIIKAEEAFKAKDYAQALKKGFLSIDRAILADRDFDEDPSGCTATVNLITADGRIFCANAGDSRTVLGIKGTAKPLSFDHKPQNEEEKARICAAGGFVDFGRVNGNLALSRAIGDFEFKKNKDLPAEKQIVTADPDVTEHQISDDDEFLVVACDGIWDCKSSQTVVEFVRRGIVAGQELHQICENIMDRCLAVSSDGGGIGCDNMTVMVVGLLQKGQTKEQWYQMIKDRVDNNEGPCAPPEQAELKGPSFQQFQTRGEPQYGSLYYRKKSQDDSDEEEDKDDNTKDGKIIVLQDGSELLKEDETTNKSAIAKEESESVDSEMTEDTRAD